MRRGGAARACTWDSGVPPDCGAQNRLREETRTRVFLAIKMRFAERTRGLYYRHGDHLHIAYDPWNPTTTVDTNISLVKLPI